MATVRKSKKSAKQRGVEAAQPPEQLPPDRAEHNRKVLDLGNRIIDVIQEANYHPTVALDAMQVLVSGGIGAALGAEHRKLWDAHAARFHDESNLLSIIGLFDELGIGEFNKKAEDFLAEIEGESGE
jgi:hypothetical protein